MLLSKPQKALLEILRQYGAVREDQAKRLLRQQYAELHFDPIVSQMISGGMIRRENEYLCNRDGNIQTDLILAIDIMFLMEPNIVEHIQKGTYPFTLTFFKERQEKLWRYDICIVLPGKESLICAGLENVGHKYRMIVFVLESPEQQPKLGVPCEHCFAWKENGTYKFYKQT